MTLFRANLYPVGGDNSAAATGNEVDLEFDFFSGIDNEKSLIRSGAIDHFSPVPVGLVQNISLSQGRNVAKIYELGSERSYQIPERSEPSFSFSKILYSGPSLLKFSHVYYLKRQATGIHDVELEKIKNVMKAADIDDVKDIENAIKSQAGSPGYGDFFINLASELFQFPIGIMLMFKNNSGKIYGAMYLEDAYISSVDFRVDTASTIIGESCGVSFDNILPLNVVPR